MLYFVPTPIGNLDDITVRGLRLLTTATLIFCEDTRNTKKLVNLLKEKHNINIQNEQTFISMHSHNEKSVIEKLNKSDFENRDVLYVSDAGMPGISDPGNLLIQFAIKENIAYEVLPGANALLLALVASGFEGVDFYFHGFLPHKSEERKSTYKKLLNLECNVVFYESTHRILKSIEELAKLFPKSEIFIIKEATKKYETHFRGYVIDVLNMLKSANLNGEYAVVIKSDKEQTNRGLVDVEDILTLSIPNKQKAKLLSKITKISTNEWYNKLNNK